MIPLVNLDLLSVGIAIAGVGILGFVVFFSNRRSATNKAFLAFAMVAIVWGISNYLNSRFTTPGAALWNLRLHLFISVWYAFTLFRLLLIFPNENINFFRGYRFVLIPIVILTSVVTLTPLVFSKIVRIAPVGEVSDPDRGPGMFLFALVAAYLVFGGIFVLFKKFIQAKGIEKVQFRLILIGILVTFSLLIAFNLVLPLFFHKLRFIPLGAVFTFPFVALTAYAITRYHLLNVKVIATEGIAFILAVVTLFEVLLSKSPTELVFRFGVFLLVLSFGILLIKSVLREVEQREELARLNEQLKVANVKLEDLSRAKTQLLSLASHQVKSPLAAIKGFAQILLEGIYGPISDKVRETLVKIRRSSDDLIALINTLLDMRRVEEGRMEYVFEKVKLADLVKDVVSGLEPLANEKKLEFTFESRSDALVNADRQKLKQVIQNMTDNAIKYTESGYVKVFLSEKGEWLTVSVVDSGRGVSPELLTHLFEEFVRDEKVKAKILGTGLGLFIAKKIIEAHGGTIAAQSEGEGKGSRFTIKLKKA
ncbi:MAG: hypothetical protein HY435_01710 [Candidatus Liptonbacteria bacterium]|nr:hypothetical protein [Candidatus Liptonbacteria bacterium]